MLDTKTAAHNDGLQLTIQTLSDQIKVYEDDAKSLKAKKNEYVDALISRQFSTQDHQKIHERMRELEADIKKLDSQLAQNQLEIVQLKDQLISVDSLKETILRLRDMEQDSLDYRPTVMAIIKQIEVTLESLTFHFKALPWTVKIPLNST